MDGSQTFSRVIPTNGFHPAWCYLLAGYDYCVARVDPELLSSLAASVPLVAMVLLAGVWWGAKLAERLGAVTLVFLAIPLVFLSYLGVLFSEAHLSWLSLIWLCYRAVVSEKKGSRDPIILGLAGAVALLARLDTGFTVLAVMTWCAVRHRSLRFGVISLLIFAIGVAPYLISNAIFFGGITPISGWIKSTFPHVCLKGLVVAGPASTWSGYSIAFGIVPIVGGLLVLCVLRPRLSTARAILYPLAAGCVAHFVYVAFFTRGHTDPYWYYIQPVFFGAIALSLFGPVVQYRVGATWLAAGALATCLVLLVAVRRTAVAETRQWVPEALAWFEKNGVQDETILVSDCPGKLAFLSDNRVMAVDMLTAHRDFYREMVESKNSLRFIADRCAERGKPLTYILYLGSNGLLPEDGDTAVVQFDPRDTDRRPIGRLSESDGLVLIGREGGMRVWSFPARN